MRCLLFFPYSQPVGQTSVRQCSTKIYTTFQTGFTLLELLVVIALLAIIAGAATLGYDGVQDQGRADVTRYEMAEIRKALLQFRRDTQEFPCRVYRAGNYVPDNIEMSQLDFTDLPAIPTTADYHEWCSNESGNQDHWGLSKLLIFPYDNTDTAYIDLLWNPDTKRGWHGPYINNQCIKDAWGNNIFLLDPELDYSPEYRCKKNGSGDYDTTGNLYSCLKASDPDWDQSTYTKEANIVRLVSMGENGDYDGINISDPCTPNQDDLILCLLK